MRYEVGYAHYIIAIATTSATFHRGEEHFTVRAGGLGFTLDPSLTTCVALTDKDKEILYDITYTCNLKTEQNPTS